MFKIKYFIFSLLFIIIASCGNNDTQNNDNFDRSEMLTYWADDIIIPAYNNYRITTNDMHSDVISFLESPTIENLTSLRITWFQAYLSYQKVGLYLLGPDQTYNVANTTNIYPTNTVLITEHADNGNYNFDLPSTFAAQGYPAIEYLINSKSDEDIITYYTDNPFHVAHLTELSNILNTKANNLHSQWVDSYRETFISLDGSSATSSVNNLTNSYIEYFDRHIRANKIATPSGVFSMGNTFPDKVEGKYTDNISKQLFLAGLDAFQFFFNGRSTVSDIEGIGFSKYLEYLENEAIAVDINNQLNSVRNLAETMSEDFEQQVISDNIKMLQLSDELQKVIVLLKTDMMQSLNIKLTYVDADGD